MADNPVYWLVSLPKKDSSRQPLNLISDLCSSQALGTPNQFLVPDLKVGTLDSLMSLSDELVKLDHSVESTTRKIGYQLHQLVEQKSAGLQVLTVGSASIDITLTRFQWDESKFASRLPCRSLFESIQGNIGRIEEEFRNQLQRYNAISQAFTAAERKRVGNLNARDLSDIVKPNDYIETEYLTTLFVVTPKYSKNDWLASYATLAQFVLPDSSRCIYEDNDSSLWTVNLFKRSVDEFRNACREKKFTAREFKIDPNNYISGQASYQKLTDELSKAKTELILWCKANFSEAFVMWLHLKAIRCHVESILRYGLPANYQAVLIQPKKKSEKKLRLELTKLFGNSGSNVYDDATKEDEFGGEKFYPYVYLEINLDMKN